MPHKIALALFSLALVSSISFADNAPNRDVTCAAAKIAAADDPFRACVMPLQPDGDLGPSGGIE